MIQITHTIKGIGRISRDLEQARKQEEKALQTAIKVEGFRLRKQLKLEIARGKPGGIPFAPLTFLGRHTKASNIRGRDQARQFGSYRAKKKALRRLGTAVRYYIPSGGPWRMLIGWVGPGVSKAWKKLARIHQEGFETPVTPELRRRFRRAGAALKGRWTGSLGRSGARVMTENKNAKFFFLRKETRVLRTPARPILDPFWRAHRKEAERNIRRNWTRKLRGERI